MDLPSDLNDLVSSLPKIQVGNEILYQFNGFWFFLPHLLGSQKVPNEFKPLPTDIILGSFPKRGTTWLKALLCSIFYGSSRESLTVKNPHDLIPTMEVQLYLPHAAIPDF